MTKTGLLWQNSNVASVQKQAIGRYCVSLKPEVSASGMVFVVDPVVDQGNDSVYVADTFRPLLGNACDGTPNSVLVRTYKSAPVCLSWGQGDAKWADVIAEENVPQVPATISGWGVEYIPSDKCNSFGMSTTPADWDFTLLGV